MQTEQAGRSQSPFSILIVDDDPATIRSLTQILHEYSPLRSAASGDAALEAARTTQPDLILLDVDTPALGGLQLCAALKQERALADIPVVFISSHLSPRTLSKGMELGATDFIGKPLQAPLVVSRVRNVQRIKALSDTLRNAVTVDFETGVNSQREFERIVAQEWLRAGRSGLPLGLVMIEIDAYSVAAEAALQSVADAVRTGAQRPSDAIGRYAGGKFGLLLPETDAPGCLAVAGRIRAAAGDVAVSIGCAQFDRASAAAARDGTRLSQEDLMATAESALLHARRHPKREIVLLDVTYGA